MSRPVGFGAHTVGLLNSVGAPRVGMESSDAGSAPARSDMASESDLSPLTLMRRAHRNQLVLCDAIEGIADRLPGNADPIQCLRIASMLVPLLRGIHRYEEDVIFKSFEELSPDEESSARSIQRLRAEHVEDECLADEITEALLAIGHGDQIRNPEALGYMMRTFFETMRRHIAFEREHILPLLAAAARPTSAA